MRRTAGFGLRARVSLLGVILSAGAAVPALRADPIPGWVQSVQGDSIDASVIDLEAFVTRAALSPGGLQASHWIASRFRAAGLDSVYLHQWTSVYPPNVVGILRGRSRPHKVVIVGGHYDSRSPFSSAPGADDNASGTACVLECARVLAGAALDFTVHFVAFSAEEIGLVGSNAYAARMEFSPDTLVAMINVDMIGYRADRDRRDLDLIPALNRSSLFDLASSTTARYVPDLPTVRGAYPGGATSDVASFWGRGFEAIAFFEDSEASSPFIHTGDDLFGLSYNDPVLARLCTQAAVALVATLAQPLGVPVAIEDLNAAHDGGRTAITWRVSTDAQTDLLSIVVQRASNPAGPFADASAGLTPRREMRFDDANAPADGLWYRLALVDRDGRTRFTAAVPVEAAGSLTTVLLPPVDRGADGIELRYAIGTAAGTATLAIYDVAGRRVRTFDAARQAGAGTHLLTWNRLDESGLPIHRGVYFVHLAAGAAGATHKLVVTGSP